MRIQICQPQLFLVRKAPKLSKLSLKYHSSALKKKTFYISIAQISIWIWWNALYNSRGNQINIAQITILQLLLTNQIKSNQMLVFDERGKPEYPGKNLSWQSRGPTNSIHIWHRVRKSNPGHIGGRQVLSSLGQPCHLQVKNYNSVTKNFREEI